LFWAKRRRKGGREGVVGSGKWNTLHARPPLQRRNSERDAASYTLKMMLG
jgi:hypothetical protein